MLGDGYGQRQLKKGQSRRAGASLSGAVGFLRVAAMAFVSTSLGVCFRSVRPPASGGIGVLGQKDAVAATPCREEE